MPRYGPFIHQVYIADGFADDCDELIHRCLKAPNFDFRIFCQIWKEMKMGCLYEGRTLGAEIAELSEEVIYVGKHYMLKDTSNFEESAIGVFIVYALLHLQPYKGFAHLRLVPEDLTSINRIEHVARREKRYDVLYALGSILIKGPVQYHAAEREHGMDLAVRKYLEGFTSIDKLGVRPKGVFRRQNEELDMLKELDVLGRRYAETKKMISDQAQCDRNLNYVDPNLPKNLEIALKKLISGIYEEHYGSLGENSREGSKISKSRRALKEKAMKQEVGQVKHYADLRKRKTNNDNPDKEESKISPKISAKKLKKDKKKVADRKKRIPISPRAVKINHRDSGSKNNESSSESDESDSNVKDKDNSDDDDSEDVALSEILKTTTIKNKGKGKKTVMKNEECNEQELDIEIDTLPVLIRTEDQGKLFEIEIIDNKEPAEKPIEKPTVKTYNKKQSAFKKINSMPDLTIKKIVEENIIEPVPSTSTADQYAKIVEINTESDKNEGKTDKTAQEKQSVGIPGSKIEKRDCKRVHIQSKFKRLGMLHIANFDEAEDIASEEVEEQDTGVQSQGKRGFTPNDE